MEDIKEKIKELEEEIRKTPYNKATQSHIGSLKRKISKLKQEITARAKKESARSKLSVKRKGDSTVVLVGFPSVGKSTLLNSLTEAESKIGAYEFTTLEAVPGMMKYKGAEIQIVDLPGIIEDASVGRGHGRKILSHARIADIIAIVIDAKKPEQYNTIIEELYEAGMRIDVKKPHIKIKKKDRGGIKIEAAAKMTKLSSEEIIKLCRKYKIHNADIIFYENSSADEFEDVLLGNRHYCSSIKIVNKIDIAEKKDLERIEKIIGNDYVKVSAEKKQGLDELKEKIFQKLEFIRVYTDDTGEPLIMKKGATVKDVAMKIHKDLVRNFRHAKITGKSAKFRDQMVGLDHVVADEDFIKIVT